MRRFGATVMLMAIAWSSLSATDDRNLAELQAYQEKWIGVRAPELGEDARDRTTGPLVQLKDYRGRRVLLYVLNSGNFVQAPDEAQLERSLRSLDEVRRASGDKLAVIGLSKSPLFFMTPNSWLTSHQSNIRDRLTSFPLIAVPNREFPEPYSEVFHRERGGIVVDENGVIVKFYSRDLTKGDMQEAMSVAEWKGEPKLAPMVDPRAGRGEPKPATSPTIAWSRPVVGITAITTGDWNGDSKPDVILCTRPTVSSAGSLLKAMVMPGKSAEAKPAILVLDTSGTEVKRLRPPDPEFNSPDFIGLSESGTTRPLLLATRSGWPDHVPVMRDDGSLAFRFRTSSAVDHACWCDLDGDGESEILVGFNGRGGIHAVDRLGKSLMHNARLANVWCVGGISRLGGKAGIPMCTDARGRVRQLKPNLEGLREITPANQYVTVFAAAHDEGEAGEHIVAIEEPTVGAQAYAVARRLDGTELWRYPVRESGRMAIPVPLCSDGKEISWLLRSGPREVVSIAADGTLVARIRISADITAVSGFSVGGETHVLIADGTRLSAYR